MSYSSLLQDAAFSEDIFSSSPADAHSWMPTVNDEVHVSIEPNGSIYSVEEEDVAFIAPKSKKAKDTSTRWNKEDLSAHQQVLHLAHDELQMCITGYKTHIGGILLYYALIVLSLGLLYLVFRWMPHWRVRLIGYRVLLEQAVWITVENSFGQYDIVPIKRITVSDAQKQDIFATTESNEQVPTHLLHLHVFEYRHVRFVCHPDQGTFMDISAWRDASWTQVASLFRGTTRELVEERLTLFGPNLIDVEMKPVGTLLMEEVLHPFYVFQIFSILFWCLDTYYVYAAVIFIISAVSIVTTLIEMRQTMLRMREMAHFSCSLRVRRNDICILRCMD
jgi:cation-transporting ATPase 13A3/4/5